MGKVFIALMGLVPFFTFAEEAIPAETLTTPNISIFSEAFGHLMGQTVKSMGIKFETGKLLRGLQDSLEGRESPMSKRECIDTFSVLHEEHLKSIAIENLKKADEFLEKNKTSPGVNVLESGKLQYLVEHQGNGPVVTDKSAPLVRYKAKFLDGTTVDIPKGEDRIDLKEQELIPGFKHALIGMKENEKRTVFVHPDLAFKTQGVSQANSLVIFEIEVIKAHVEKENQLDVN